MRVRAEVLQRGKITIPAKIRETRDKRRRLPETGRSSNKLVLFPPKTNPTEMLSGLAEGAPIEEPLKQELRKATVTRAEARRHTNAANDEEKRC